MTPKQAAECLARAGAPIPADLAPPSAEHIRNTRRKEVGGIVFRSTLEATAYQILKSWESAGVIESLELQPKYLLQPKFRHEGRAIREMVYKPDFRFTDRRPGARGETFVIESKGFKTEPYRMRRKMFLAKYGTAVIYQVWTAEVLKQLQ